MEQTTLFSGDNTGEVNTGLLFKEALEQAREGGYQNELNEIAPEMDIVKSPISSLKGVNLSISHVDRAVPIAIDISSPLPQSGLALHSSGTNDGGSTTPGSETTVPSETRHGLLEWTADSEQLTATASPRDLIVSQQELVILVAEVDPLSEARAQSHDASTLSKGRATPPQGATIPPPQPEVNLKARAARAVDSDSTEDAYEHGAAHAPAAHPRGLIYHLFERAAASGVTLAGQAGPAPSGMVTVIVPRMETRETHTPNPDSLPEGHDPEGQKFPTRNADTVIMRRDKTEVDHITYGFIYLLWERLARKSRIHANNLKARAPQEEVSVTPTVGTPPASFGKRGTVETGKPTVRAAAPPTQTLKFLMKRAILTEAVATPTEVIPHPESSIPFTKRAAKTGAENPQRQARQSNPPGSFRKRAPDTVAAQTTTARVPQPVVSLSLTKRAPQEEAPVTHTIGPRQAEAPVTFTKRTPQTFKA